MPTITEADFLALLRRPESEGLDFKKSEYDLSAEHGKASFVKDIICMANTPREQPAIICLGVSKFPDGRFELAGVGRHPDDAELQNLLADSIEPIPRFSYEVVHSGGRTFGIIVVPPATRGPSLPVRDLGPTGTQALRKNQIYLRRGSTNALASGDEIRRVVGWFSGHDTSRIDGVTVPYDDDAWERLLSAVHRFGPGYNYILIASPLPASSRPYLATLGRIPWAAAFDLDPDSDSSGLLNVVRSELEARRGLHLVVWGERPITTSARSTRWFFARGLRGRQGTISDGRFKDWLQHYGAEVRRQADVIARSLTLGPVVAIVIWDTPTLNRHLQSILEALLESMSTALEIVCLTEQDQGLEALVRDLDVNNIMIPFAHVASGLEHALSARATNSDIVVPSSSGAPIVISEKDAAWLNEDLEVVHLGVGTTPPEGRDVGVDFLKGKQIHWYELGLHRDVDRDLTLRLSERIRKDLKQRQTVRVNLFHSPGAGGSTVGRRVAWDLHRLVPVAVLWRFVRDETIERIFRLASLTGHPVLVVCDGATITDGEVEELFTELRSRQIATVILQVLRRFTAYDERERSFYLPNTLSAAELRRFVDTLVQIRPRKREPLERIVRSESQQLHSPFYLGLTTFGRDFLGLEPYVAQRLGAATDSARSVALEIALAHHYAQRPVPAQLFASVLGAPDTRPVRLTDALPPAVLELMLEEPRGHWRTAHELIAVEILQQVLSRGSTDRRYWKQELSAEAIAFIRVCQNAAPYITQGVLELLKRFFIFRDNVDVLGSERAAASRYAQLLEDIPSREGRLAVLEALVAEFPDEAHFWAHLGRYLSLTMQDFRRALECIQRAIALEEDDHVLHHMKGMMLRKEAELAMAHRREIGDVIAIAKQANESFQEARSRGPEDEHGYISEAQMIIGVLDYFGRSRQCGLMTALMGVDVDPFLREGFERAEELLRGARGLREGERSSAYEVDCRGKLEALYGRFDVALQTWDSMLQLPGIYRPALRRQIVRTYLARRERVWSNLTRKEVERSVRLLEENLDEEPYRDQDLKLWLEGIRYAEKLPLPEAVIEKVSYWKSRSGSLEACYYLYVLHFLLAIDGSELHRGEAEAFLNETRVLARRRRDRTHSLEWLGGGEGISALVHRSELGEWDSDADFWEQSGRLKRVKGRVQRIEGPQSGWIEMAGGMRAFFVPAKGGYARGSAENAAVDFFVGFSFDGPRSWDVRSLM